MVTRLNPYVIKYIIEIANDYQFNRADDRYLGFININPRDSGNNTLFAMELVRRHRDYENILNSLGLEFESGPWEEEMVITEIQIKVW